MHVYPGVAGAEAGGSGATLEVLLGNFNLNTAAPGYATTRRQPSAGGPLKVTDSLSATAMVEEEISLGERS